MEYLLPSYQIQWQNPKTIPDGKAFRRTGRRCGIILGKEPGTRGDENVEELSLTGKEAGHGTPEELKNLSALLIVDGDVTVDNAAVHGKSRWERNIRFERWTEPGDPPAGKRVAVVWLTLGKRDGHWGYSGAAACRMWIDREAGKGYKNLAEQVNQMEKAVKGNVDVSLLTGEETRALLQFLQSYRADLWEHANPALQSLGE
jgi:hypothetical protein